MAAENMNMIRRSKKDRRTGSIVPDVIIYLILIFAILIVLFPFYNVILLSFAPYDNIAGARFYVWPRGFTLENYASVLENELFLRSIGISVFNVITGVAMNLVMTTIAAYSLNRKDLPFRKTISYLILLTMFFGAGLVPWYLVVRNLGLVNNIMVMTVPGMIGTFNIILMRNFFNSIPASLEESAKIDGAGEFVVMTQIYVPLSKPIYATIGLFCAVGLWNDWWLAHLFIQTQRLFPLALVIRRAVIENSIPLSDIAASFRSKVVTIYPRSLQSAAIMIAIVPIMMVYPFLQKYFAKGIMLGAIKA